MQKVRDVMTRPAISVGPDTSIRDVARLLVEHNISGIPVVDAGGATLGVISEVDLLVKEGGRDSIPHRPLARLFGESRETQKALARVEARTVGDAMTSPAITIEADRPLQYAAALMVRKGIKRLPVIDDGVLVGIVTRTDLVRASIRSDEDLAETIRQDVLLRALWINPADFEVSVREGVVTVRGTVGRRSTAAMLPRFIQVVPGVVAVDAQVDWTLDDGDIHAAAGDLMGPYYG
jgi:CBS domain-containing protein